MQKLFILAVGGTGARVLRSFLMLLASNVELQNISEVIPILIDLDKDNGDTQRTLELLEEYHKIRKVAYKNKEYQGFFQQPIKSIHGLVDGNTEDVGGDFFMHFAADNVSFSDYIEYQSLSLEDKGLIDALYNTENATSVNAELNLNLSVGFKGNPNIGSIVLDEIDKTTEFKQLENSFKTGDKIFIIGSLFGGTGASGLPHLVRKIRNSTKGGINGADIGTVAVMPYFGVASDDNSAISSLTFASKTKAALSYYANEMDEKITAMYYVGDNAGNSYKNNEGGEDQKNKAHIVELFSAMSIFRFVELPPNTKPTVYHEFGVDAISEKMQFADFNEKTKNSFFIPLTKFFLLSKLFRTELHKATKTVFYKRLDLGNNLKTDSFYTSFANFTNGFWNWLNELDGNKRSFSPFLLNGSFNQIIQGGKVIKDGFLARTLTTQIIDGLTNELIELEREAGDDGEGLSKEEKRIRKIQQFVQSTYITFDKIFQNKFEPLPSQQNEDGTAYIFKLHSGGKANLKDWSASHLITDNIIQTIEDKIEDDSNAKVATSIPTPFARIRLFDTAFKIVNSNYNEESIYKKLVSDCLDVFQMVFILGNNDRLKFKTWNRTQRLNELKGANTEGNKRLGNSLEFFFGETAFTDLNELQLIYLDNKLVGGTSPFTMFFTSPNWRAINDGNAITTPTNRKLFLDKSDLKSRDTKFQKYLRRFKQVYGGNMTDSNALKAFFSYIDKQTDEGLSDYISENQREIDDYNLSSWNNDSRYESIAIESNRTLKVGNLEIKTKKIGVPDEPGAPQEMWISPTITHYQQRYGDRIPLFLLEGNHGFKYFQTTWSSDIRIDPDDVYIPINERMVPGLANVNYPYLSAFDFFADKVIRLPYNINEEQYEVLNGQGNLLLPISPVYFDFFTIEDLRQNLVIEDNDDEITLRLSIPIYGQNLDGNETLTIEKTYFYEDIFNDDNAQSHIGLGIFPFYKITDATPNAQQLNEYNMMLVHGKDVVNPSLKVFKFANSTEKILLNFSIRSEIDSSSFASTFHYNLNGDYFDFGEIQIEDAKGIFIPKFKEISDINGSTSHHFAVDFGTSNTHICHSTSTSINSLQIVKDDKQVGFLHGQQNQRKDLLGGFFEGVEYLALEFMPEYIGNGEVINYPIKTALYESNAFKKLNQLKLFNDVNIAFDVKEVGQNTITTDIKWALEKNHLDTTAKRRVKAYFKQTLILAKHKIIQNKGNISESKLVWFVPTSMSPTVRGIFDLLWKEASNEVFLNFGFRIEYEEESIAPYYSLQQKYGFGSAQTVLNIDIGGGTTDVILVSQDKDRYFRTSYRFAGNDIWGDGIVKTLQRPKDNGFVKMMEKAGNKVDVSSSEIKASYDFYKTQAKHLGSEHICGFMFKHNDKFNFTGKILQSNLRSLLVFHYAANIYFLSNIFKEIGLPLPEIITFTGKGSEYLRLIGSESSLEELSQLFWKKFSGNDLVNLELRMPENPKELTAQGGIVKLKEISELDLSKKKIPTTKQTRVKNVESIKEQTLAYNQQFIDALFEENLQETLMDDFDIDFRVDKEILAKLKSSWLEKSFREMALEARQNSPTQKVSDVLFFWGLKNIIYQLSKEMMKS